MANLKDEYKAWVLGIPAIELADKKITSFECQNICTVFVSDLYLLVKKEHNIPLSNFCCSEVWRIVLLRDE